MKKIYTAGLGLSLFLFASSGCQQVSQEQQVTAEVQMPQPKVESLSDAGLLHKSAQQLTRVIVYDIFKPPVASRIYAYSFLAAYEALQSQSPEYQSLGEKLNGFEAVPQPEAGKEYNLSLASIKAFNIVGKTLTFSDNLWEEYEQEMEQQFKAKGMPEDVYARSVAYGELVAAHVLAYANTDNYKKTRGYRHTLKHTAGSWEPTPPTYAEACEAKWNTIRSFTMKSADQFPPAPPVKYDLKENSPFFKMVREVYDINKGMTEEQRSIAYFWDDNPFVTNIVGHATFTEKKMTPPGHWIEIVRTVSQDKKLEMLPAVEAYSLSSIALFDAFIACWDAKYKTDRVRPVTVINSTFDPDWMPFLETPAFPEYVSGHSSISASAGRVLTHIFGDKVAFTDSTEYQYGHGVRSFESFEQAYWETSMSRVYGGIHFKDGVEQGTYQGEKVGDWVWARLKGQPATIANGKPGKVTTMQASAKQ